MKSCMFLMMFLALSSAVPSEPDKPDVVDLGEGDDINISDINEGSMADDILEDPNPQRSATNSKSLWTSPVPYNLGKDLDMHSKGVILKAFDQFRVKSCIDFKPWESEEYYISVKGLNGCYSYIGRIIPDGQDLSIGTFCGKIAIIEHEFLHALGFFHEHSRYDRDDYVKIVPENIIEGAERNFNRVSRKESTTQGVEYDYLSVMHYGKDYHNNGKGSTIVTLDPKYQDLIGQRVEMSPRDVLELNLLYKCNSTIAFQMHCDFHNGTMCEMSHCSNSAMSWEIVTDVQGGPSSDHTNLPGASGDHGGDDGYFMHVSTAVGDEGDSAWLETHQMSPKRECPVQCFQFYYYHTGNDSDTLNVWIREFDGVEDSNGTRRLMGQITGPPTSHWKLHHVPLTASKLFQVEFEVRKGAGSSAGGFSIDDINLSETECPHVTLQVDNFEELLSTSPFGTTIYSPRQYSAEGYAYRIATRLYQTYIGLFVQLLSGDYDDKLEWPCPYRQVHLKVLDQNSNLQMQMSKQLSRTTDHEIDVDGLYLWDNPRENGSSFIDENNEEVFRGKLVGQIKFMFLREMKTRDYLKGESVIFTGSIQDITPLFSNNVLPCAPVIPVKVTNSSRSPDEGPCSLRNVTTSIPLPLTPAEEISTTKATVLQFWQTTEDRSSAFDFSPARMASPVLTILLAILLLIH